MRSTRRLVVLITLCLGLGLSFGAVAGARSDASSRGAPPTDAAVPGDHHRSDSSRPGAPLGDDERETEAEIAEPDEVAAEPGPGEDAAMSSLEADPEPEVLSAAETDSELEVEAETEAGAAAADGLLDLDVTGGGTLVQVGRTLSYGIAVSNVGTDPLGEVVVQIQLAPELALLDAGGAEATGSSVTWMLPSLAPGATQGLDLEARVAGAGDLRALTEVSAMASGAPEPTARSLETFIGALRGVSTRNPEPRIFEEITVMRPREVVVRVDDEVLGRTILPVTGVPVGMLTSGGLLLIALGSLALASARGPQRAIPARLLVVSLLVLAACTQGAEDVPERAAPETPPAPVASPTETKEGDDEVLGTVVEPADADEDAERPEEPSEGAASDDVAAAPEATTVQTITVQDEVVRKRRLRADEIPVQTLGTTGGANTISLEWTGSDIGTAASSILFDPSAPAEVTTSLGSSDGAVEVGVTVTNLLDDRRLAVQGRVVHEVTGPGGFHAVLRSEPIDVILNPEGTTTYRFAYALPAGDYGLTSRFEANG